ncbi:MAG TPA: DNA-protecting protein DprA, partial [Devosia sp.]|nr:DNA-protecting protein DprA [Devosia sp.]
MYSPDQSKRQLTHPQRVAWLRLIRSSNVGPTTFRQLINKFGTAEEALAVLPELTRRGGSKTSPRITPVEQAEYELEQLNNMGARMVGIGEPDYPHLLQFIHSPPPLISIMGTIRQNDDKAIAIVGARNASAAGHKLTAKLAAELGNAGYVIVSGLARGIDAVAHSSSLETGTIAVYAGGLDKTYPSENKALAQRILENEGALISEMPLGSTPRAKDFPRRNRLVSGIAKGVLVIEAALRSGSLITARLALEQNREVFAVPGSPLDPRANGTNKLIKDGATLVTCADDIVDELATGSHTPNL